jgi:hypothetical protein
MALEDRVPQFGRDTSPKERSRNRMNIGQDWLNKEKKETPRWIEEKQGNARDQCPGVDTCCLETTSLL